MKKWRVKPIVAACFLSSSVFLTGVAHADDIEIYLQPPSDPVYPNILFILDESGSMGSTDVCKAYKKNGSCKSYQTRLDALKEAMINLLDSGSIDDAKIGIMGYTTSYSFEFIDKKRLPSRQIVPGSKPAAIYWGPRLRSLYYGSNTGFGLVKDVKAQLKNAINDLMANSATPTMEALAAGVEWFRVGFTETIHPRDEGMGDHVNVSFDSPLDEDYYCAPNHIVLLTDGRPNLNRGWAYYNTTDGYYVVSVKDPNLKTYPEVPDEPNPTVTPNLAPYGGDLCSKYDPDNPFDYDDYWRGGLCAREVSTWAFNTDLRSNWAKQQRIFIHTIGFKTDSEHRKFLELISSSGGGNFYESNNSQDLLDAFQAIASDAGSTISYTYTAPAVPFNADNAAVSGTDIYVPLLVPDAKRFWQGNLKRYRVDYDETTKKVVIKDKYGAGVLDATFNFKDTTDYWNATGSSDGAETLVGGVVSKMNGARTRYLYTYLGTPNNTLLVSNSNRVVKDNNTITKELLNAGSSDERTAVLNWANWKDPSGNAINGVLGAPLHTKPVVVRYPNSAYSLVFLATTDGILHAFRSDTGEEHWAFMPDELLNLLKVAKDNVDASLPIYGLDGPMTYYEIGNRKYIVFGMRRGGRNLYALDVTDRDNPKFAWEIKGGETSGFDNLGQTWSPPIMVKMKIEDNAPADVLVFGGGYDPDEALRAVGSSDQMGNSIYIVNPLTGALIREITSNDLVRGRMDNGIVAGVLPVDINANGHVDRLYAADVAGRIIRVDIPDEQLAQITGSNKLTATVLANVNTETVSGNTTTDPKSDFQKFFNTPEVAYYNRGGETYLALLIASGHRPSPLDDSTTDRFYMIKDPHVWTAPADADSDGKPDYVDIIEENDLYDATNNLVQDGADGDCTDSELDTNPNNKRSCAKQQLKAAQGWYMDFDNGEKGFSEAKVYDYAVFFTTYQVDAGNASQNSDPCTASSSDGQANLYVVNMADGSAMVDIVNGMFDQSSDGSLDKTDRKVQLHIPGMPPSPVLLFPDTSVDGETRLGGSVVAIVGLETVLEWADRFHPISWEEVIEE